MVHRGQEVQLPRSSQRDIPQAPDANRLEHRRIERLDVLDHLGKQPGERVMKADRRVLDLEVDELVDPSAEDNLVDVGSRTGHAREETREGTGELDGFRETVSFAERAADLAELDRDVERRDPSIRLVLDVGGDRSLVGVHRGEEVEEGSEVVDEGERVAEESTDGRGGDEMVEVAKNLEVALLLEGGRFGVDSMDGGIGREDEVLSVGGVELLGEEGVEDGDEAGEELVLRDEEGADARDREDLDAKEDDRVLRFPICEEVRLGDVRVDLSKVDA